MVIFIVEEGSIWNERNPILEKYADSVVVVCLYGKDVTDKYRCIVSPKRQVRLGMDAYGTEGFLFGAISLAKEELKACISHEKDIVFLTDNEPRSLYPYILLKNECEGKRVHLWCISPLRFESKFRIKSYYKMLQSIDVITSLLFLNFNDFLYTMDRRSTLSDLFEYCSDYLNELLPNALHEINNLMKPDEKYFYDFTSRRYISTKNNYMDMLKDKNTDDNETEYLPVEVMIYSEEQIYTECPKEDMFTKELVEKLYPRYNGKKICEKLKTMRKQLADENGISFETVQCPSTGPCAGTCEHCDNEISYLMSELYKIPEEDRKYPKFTIDREENFYSEPETLTGLISKEEIKKDKAQILIIPEFLRKKRDDDNG